MTMLLDSKDVTHEKLTVIDYDFDKDEKVFKDKPEKFISTCPVKYASNIGITDLQIVLRGVCYTDGIVAKTFGDKTNYSIGITLGKSSSEHLVKTIENFIDTWRGIRKLRNKGITNLGSTVYCKVKHDGEDYGCYLNGGPINKATLVEQKGALISIIVSLKMYVNWKDELVGVSLLTENIGTE